VACPAHATCAASIGGDAHAQPAPDSGYWIDRAAVATDPLLVREVYACPLDTCGATDLGDDDGVASDGRRLGAASDCLSLANYSSASCARANCGRGSDGPLCAACASGWRVSGHSRRCEKCDQPRTTARSLALLLSAALLAAALIFAAHPRARATLARLLAVPCSRWGKHAFCLDSIDGGALKLLWTTAQVGT